MENIFYDLVSLLVFDYHLFSPPPFFSFLIGICSTYPRLINSCSSCSEMYALSRHRGVVFLFFFFLILGLDEDIDFGLLITTLSITSDTRLMSWVLAGDITADNGIPFLSVKICLFVQPSLLLYL